MDREKMLQLVEEVEQERARYRLGGGQAEIDKQHKRKKQRLGRG